MKIIILTFLLISSVWANQHCETHCYDSFAGDSQQCDTDCYDY